MERDIEALLPSIFSGRPISEDLILDIFEYQYTHNKVYQDWCNALHKTPKNIHIVDQIPYLPIQFFKTEKVICGDFEPELLFQSSGTTQMNNRSQHLIKKAAIYEESFVKGFELFYGDPKDYCIIGLLPNYLENGHSSLIKMVNDLIKLSKDENSGFYLYDFDKLATVLEQLEKKGKKILLFGVTFALLDFAEAHPIQLHNTIIMETGGMKGRKKEMTREEVHNFLEKQLGVTEIHSEYGMTELLSQGYSKADGVYSTPQWLKISVREETDPLNIRHQGQGIINVMDLANIYSCSFIATDDVGFIQADGSFEVRGRLDQSDIRGCSLLVV